MCFNGLIRWTTCSWQVLSSGNVLFEPGGTYIIKILNHQRANSTKSDEAVTFKCTFKRKHYFCLCVPTFGLLHSCKQVLDVGGLSSAPAPCLPFFISISSGGKQCCLVFIACLKIPFNIFILQHILATQRAYLINANFALSETKLPESWKSQLSCDTIGFAVGYMRRMHNKLKPWACLVWEDVFENISCVMSAKLYNKIKDNLLWK